MQEESFNLFILQTATLIDIKSNRYMKYVNLTLLIDQSFYQMIFHHLQFMVFNQSGMERLLQVGIHIVPTRSST